MESVGDARGHACTSRGVGLHVAPSVDHPSTSKRSRSPMDVLWKVKRSRAEVEGNLASIRPCILSARDQDGEQLASRDPVHHPSALGEGQALGLRTSGVVVVESTQSTQPLGGESRASHSLFPVLVAYKNYRSYYLFSALHHPPHLSSQPIVTSHNISASPTTRSLTTTPRSAGHQIMVPGPDTSQDPTRFQRRVLT